MLRRLVDEAGELWKLYVSKLEPEGGPFEKPEFTSFVLTLQGVFTERAKTAVLDFFRNPEGARQFLKEDTLRLSHRLFLDATGALWTGDPGGAPMEQLLGDAPRNLIIQRNAHLFLDLSSGRHQISLAVDPARMQTLLRNPRIAVAFWNAAIAQPIQFRMLHETRAIRTRLIAGGVDERQLAFPDWLHVGEEREERRGCGSAWNS